MHITCLSSMVFVCRLEAIAEGIEKFMKKGYLGNSLSIGALKGDHF